MDFSTAYYKMLNGDKIKMPSWEGYWAWENNTIMIHCKDGNVLDIRHTKNVAWTFSFIASNEWVVMDEEKKTVSVKPKFRLEDYRNGEFVMHCDTKEKADIFLGVLHCHGRKWNDGSFYSKKDNWNTYKQDTAYSFNAGQYSPVKYYKSKYYTVLEFDNFDWN